MYNSIFIRFSFWILALFCNIPVIIKADLNDNSSA